MLPFLPLLLLTLAFSALGCASRPDDAVPPVTPPAEDLQSRLRHPCEGPSTEGPTTKVRAPVELALTAAGPHDALVLMLRIRATADIPRAVARFTLPAGVVMVAGQLEQDLGPLVQDAVATVTITVRVPPEARPMLVAGVDCHLSPGVKLYGVTQLTLGATLPNPDSGVRLLKHDAVRASPPYRLGLPLRASPPDSLGLPLRASPPDSLGLPLRASPAQRANP